MTKATPVTKATLVKKATPVTKATLVKKAAPVTKATPVTLVTKETKATPVIKEWLVIRGIKVMCCLKFNHFITILQFTCISILNSYLGPLNVRHLEPIIIIIVWSVY